MKEVMENISPVVSSCDQKVCVMLSGDGVYYAQFQVPGQEIPLVVILHGITTDKQAAAALETLTQGQRQPCDSLVPLA